MSETTRRQPLSIDADDEARRERYEAIDEEMRAMLADEEDWTAAMATVASLLHGAFDYYDWTGFYRRTAPKLLVIGPYQGPPGCLRIEFSRGVCGAAARERATQLVDDVHSFPGYIACSGETESEIVVPVMSPGCDLLAVLDVDSDTPAAFGPADQEALEEMCAWLGSEFG